MEKNIRLSDRIGSQIRQDIKAGKYKAGEKIPAEPELMKLYEVGRSTVREAIKALAMAGVLQVQQGFGTVVNKIQPDAESMDSRFKRADFEEINAVRQLLDKEVVELAANKRTSEQLQAMEQHLNERRQAIENDNLQACMDADIAFHLAIAHATGNTVLADLYQSFTSVIRSFFVKRNAQGMGHFAISHHLHVQLYHAIKSNKAKQARQTMQQILDNNY